MRKTSDLKFNPIKFSTYGINGSVGTKNLEEFFRSTLSQNICYCVRNTAKTINEIADDLGVSPVYVEAEVDFLEEYGFLLETGGKYIVNFIISEPTAELLIMRDTMYKKVAGLFANELYDELTASGLLESSDILCGQTDKPLSPTEGHRPNRNFILWSLIPYIVACSGEKLMDNKISFSEVATIRPDGAHNICNASVISDNMILPDDYVYMRNFCGPYTYLEIGNTGFWQLDTEWSANRIKVSISDYESTKRILSLYEQEKEYPLLKEDYAWLSELGYIKTWGDYDGEFKTSWQIVRLENKEIKDKLLALGEKIKEKYKAEFDVIKEPYVKAVMDSVPAHLRKVKEYELQFILHSDGWFLLHCIVALLNNGKLKLPTEEQRKALTTLIVPN